MFLGIRFLTSGANERANVKGKIPLFLTGVILIFLCGTVAGKLAEIVGNEDADQVVAGAIDASGGKIGTVNEYVDDPGEYGDSHFGSSYRDKDKWVKYDEDGKYNLFDPYKMATLTNIRKDSETGYPRVNLSAKEYTNKTGRFLYWRVQKDDGSEEIIINRTYNGVIEGTEGVKVTPVYEKDLTKEKTPDKWGNVQIYTPDGVTVTIHDILGSLECTASNPRLKYEGWLVREIELMPGDKTRVLSEEIHSPELVLLKMKDILKMLEDGEDGNSIKLQITPLYGYHTPEEQRVHDNYHNTNYGSN